MKKIISVITVLSVIFQLVPNMVKAASLYDAFFNSGLVAIFSEVEDKVEIFNPTNPATPTQYSNGNTNGGFVLFLPNGDLVTYHMDNTLHCLSKASNFSSTCAWSGLNLSGSVGSLSMEIIDPKGDRATHTPSGNPLASIPSEFAITGAVDSLGNIWLAHYAPAGPTMFGQYVSKIAPPYDTVKLYDLSFGSCANPARLNEYDCESVAPASTWTDVESHNVFGLTVDYFGDIWVTASYSESGDAGSKVYCLDAANNYGVCTGGALSVYGGIDIGHRPSGIAADSGSNIYIPTVDNFIYKLTKSNGYTATSASVPNMPWAVVVDSSDRVWLHSSTGDETAGDIASEVFCFNSNLTACATASISYRNNASDLPGAISVDSSGNIWVVKVGATGGRLYCFTPAGGNCSTSAPFTADANSKYYIPTGGLNNQQGNNWGDITGYKITSLMNMTAGQDQVDIAATVDPTISLTVSPSICDIGNLTTAAANTCTYDVTTATNAASGLVVKFDADTAYLASGANTIDACASSGCTGGVNAGTEEYGFYVSTVGSAHDATGYNADSEPLPTSATTVITAADPHTDTTSTITHKAAVSSVTPAGAYFHTVTVTAVGSF